MFLFLYLFLGVGFRCVSLGSLVEISIINGNDYKEAEFYFHFGESYLSFVAILPTFFILTPLVFQIDLQAL